MTRKDQDQQRTQKQPQTPTLTQLDKEVALLKQDMEYNKQAIQRVEDKIDPMALQLNEIHHNLSRQKGFYEGQETAQQHQHGNGNGNKKKKLGIVSAFGAAITGGAIAVFQWLKPW